MRRFLFLLVVLVCGCDGLFDDGEDEYINIPNRYWVTAVRVQTYDRRLGDAGPIVPADSLTREFRLGVGGITRLELGTCSPDPCQNQIEVQNPPVRVEIYLDTAVTISGTAIPAGADLAEPLSLGDLNELTRRYVLVGPRAPGARLDVEGVLIPNGTRTVRVTWFTEGDAETFTDSVAVKWLGPID